MPRRSYAIAAIVFTLIIAIAETNYARLNETKKVVGTTTITCTTYEVHSPELFGYLDTKVEKRAECPNPNN